MGPFRYFFAACILASLFAPALSVAGLRGAFDPLTTNSSIYNGFEQPALRPYPAVDGVESYFAFSTRSLIPRYETSREIWIHKNVSRAGLNLSGAELETVRTPLLRDPTGLISYTDPAWSPDGRYLAYAKTDRYITHSSIYVQEYALGATLAEAATPIGDPILVVSGDDGTHNLRPAWSPDGTSLAFDSDLSGYSLDIWTVRVFPTVEAPVPRTDGTFRAEIGPAWSPDGTRIAFSSNVVGLFAVYIVDLTTPPPHAILPAVSKSIGTTSARNVAWSSDGRSLYYDAPSADNPENVNDIWKLDLDTQTRCPIFIDQAADWDVDVSRHVHTSPDGIDYNYFLFTSLAATSLGPGPNVWRAQFIQNCVTPLPLGVTFQPSTLQIGASGQDVVATLQFPVETQAKGYQCQSFDGPAEGVRMRVTIIPSPALYGFPARGDRSELRQFGATATPIYRDYVQGGDPRIDVRFSRALVESILVARGLVGRQVPIEIRAYSNLVGRQFLGYGYIKLSASSLASDAPREGLGDSGPAVAATPNPFNPATTIRFRVAAPGEVSVRLHDARGALVRTLVRGWYPQGPHEVRWDGRDDGGAGVASGVYFVSLESSGAMPARAKLILMK
jgi:hypothetical protein